MYIESYKYYLKMTKDLPEFDRGLGFFFIPTVILFFLSGIFLFPFHFFIKSRLFGKRKGKENKIIEFIFRTTHLKISENLNLPKTTKFYFNIKKNLHNKQQISDKKLLFISLFYGIEVSLLLLKSLESSKINKNGIRLIKIVALSKLAQYHFKGCQVFIQYNDHIPYNVMLEFLAKKNGIKTIYIQHAPISYAFPKLYHDLNVLFSKDSLVKYKTITGKGFKEDTCFKLFDVRFPKQEDLLPREKRYCLICFNELDSIKRVKSLTKKLIMKGIKVKVRPHPQDDREFNFHKNIDVSLNVDIWEDLSKAHSVIVNESAVPLESLYYNIPTYKLSSLSLTIRDNYGFLKTGLITKEYFSEDLLIMDLLNKEKVWNNDKLNYFLGSIYNRDERLMMLQKTIIKM